MVAPLHDGRSREGVRIVARRSFRISTTTESIYERGLGSAEIAVCIIFRLVRGCKDDVVEFAPYYPAALAQHLERGSEAISRFRTPSQLIPLLAVLGMMNSSYLASDSTQPWVELPLINAGVLIGSVLIWNQHRLWARRVLHGLIGLMYLLAASVMIGVVVQQRLYEMPDFDELVLQFALVASSIALVLLVASNGFRARVFGGRWWPVFLCWPLIVATSIGVVTMAGWDPLLLITGWAVAPVVTPLDDSGCNLRAWSGRHLVRWSKGERILSLAIGGNRYPTPSLGRPFGANVVPSPPQSADVHAHRP